MRRLLVITAPILVGFFLFSPPARAAWVWPLQGEVITAYQNGSDPYASGQHRGIDIAGEVGTPVVAATSGEVRYAGTAGSSGLTVGVRSADGLFDSSYLHLSTVSVRPGDRVEAGQRIGVVGTTGTRSAQRPHLHFGVRDAGSRHAYHDPLALLPPLGAAPERPREAPAPEPLPVPLTPAPEPEPVRQPSRRRIPQGRRVREPRRVPAGRRVPRGERSPAPRPVAVPQPAPAPLRDPSPRASPRAAPQPDRAPSPRPVSQPVPDKRPASSRAASPRAERIGPESPGLRAQSPAPMAQPDAGPPRPAQPLAPSAGPGLGWALACVGLLLAAALLGLSEDGRKASRRSRDRVVGLLRPLLGRR